MRDLTPELTERLFKGANKRFKVIPRGKLAKREAEKQRSEEEWSKIVAREEGRRESKKKQLKDLGIDYEFEVAKPVDVVVTEEAESEEKKEEPKAIKAAEEPVEKEDEAAAEAVKEVLKPKKAAKKEDKKEKVPVKARKSKRVAAKAK